MDRLDGISISLDDLAAQLQIVGQVQIVKLFGFEELLVER